MKKIHYNHRISHFFFSLLLAFIVFSFTTQQVISGTLDDFEEDATRPHEKEKRERRRTPSTNEGEDIFDSCIESLGIAEGIGMAVGKAAELVIIMNKNSWNRVFSPQDIYNGLSPRKKGEALLPFIRLDTGFQYVDSDIDALDFRLEVGAGPFGAQFRQTHYDERIPVDELDIKQWHLMTRMSAKYLEVDLGLGSMIIEGNNTNSGFSFTLPILFHPKDFAGVEFRPAWAFINDNTIQDYELTLSLGWQYISFRIGYRWMCSPHVSLSGPLAGLSLRY